MKDPVRRAEYLLTRAGIDIGGKQADATAVRSSGPWRSAAPPAFLMEILELNDELAAARRAGDAVQGRVHGRGDAGAGGASR